MATDLDKLQGTWNITSLESDGQSVPSAAIAGTQISITKTLSSLLAWALLTKAESK